MSLSIKALLAREEPARKGEKKTEPESPDEPPPPKKKRQVPLKGGMDRPTGGEDVGLKW